jgi:hypothetical protein
MSCQVNSQSRSDSIGFLALGCAFALPIALFFGLMSAGKKHVAERNAQTVAKSAFGVTFQHNGHLWTRFDGGDPIHDPGCPCKK